MVRVELAALDPAEVEAVVVLVGRAAVRLAVAVAAVAVLLAVRSAAQLGRWPVAATNGTYTGRRSRDT